MDARHLPGSKDDSQNKVGSYAYYKGLKTIGKELAAVRVQ